MSVISYGAPVTEKWSQTFCMHLCTYIKRKLRGSCVFQMWQRVGSWLIRINTVEYPPVSWNVKMLVAIQGVDNMSYVGTDFCSSKWLVKTFWSFAHLVWNTLYNTCVPLATESVNLQKESVIHFDIISRRGTCLKRNVKWSSGSKRYSSHCSEQVGAGTPGIQTSPLNWFGGEVAAIGRRLGAGNYSRNETWNLCNYQTSFWEN